MIKNMITKLVTRLFTKRYHSFEGYESVQIKELEFKSGKFTMTAQHPMFVHFVDAMANFFKDTGGENYVSTSFYSPEFGFMEVLIQRQDGKTPAQLKSELEKRYEKDVLFLTSHMECHPEEWEGLCACRDCRSIAAQDA